MWKIKMFRSMSLCFLLLATALLTSFGCSRSGYESPEAVFDTFTQAADKEDLITLCGCLTPESVDQMAAQMIVGAVTMKTLGAFTNAIGSSQDEADTKLMQKAVKDLDSTLRKHGITEKTMGGIPDPTRPPDVAKLTAPVKDKAALVSELANIFKKLGTGEEPKTYADLIESTLQDVRVSGNSATGTLVRNGSRQSITFKKVDGSWRIIMNTNQLY